MRALFFAVWLAHGVFFAGTADWLPAQVGSPGKEMPREAYLVLLGSHTVLAAAIVPVGGWPRKACPRMP